MMIPVQRIAAVLLAVGTALGVAHAEEPEAEPDLKYFVVQARLTPETAKKLMNNPADPIPAARAMVSSIEGARLVDYYLAVGSAANLAIIAVPDSKYAAAITWQRMATGALEDIVVYEVIPAKKFPEILELARAMNGKKEAQ